MKHAPGTKMESLCAKCVTNRPLLQGARLGNTFLILTFKRYGSFFNIYFLLIHIHSVVVQHDFSNVSC